MLEDDGVLPDKADDAWSGGLDDAGQSTARPATAGPGSAATGRPATTEPGADAGSCPERDQARSEYARAQLPPASRRYQDATRGWRPDLADNPVHATTATTAGSAVAWFCGPFQIGPTIKVVHIAFHVLDSVCEHIPYPEAAVPLGAHAPTGTA